MKKFLILIFTIMMVGMMAFTGCSGDKPVKVLENFLTMLETPATVERIEEAQEFLDANLKYMDEEDADYMLGELQNYAFAFDTNALDYSDLAQRYQKHISAALYDLYILMAEEQDKPSVIDATLQISWRALCERALQLEAYITENKDYLPTKEEAVWMYETAINSMLIGATKSPIFSYETEEFSQDAYDTFVAVAAENPDTTVAWVIEEYFNYLESVNYTLNHKDTDENNAFFDTCSHLVSEAGKRVYQ